MSQLDREVILGVDTHLDTLVGAVVDDLGRARGTLVIPLTPAGSEQLLAWTRSLGVLKRAGVDGTGTYGAALARALTNAGVQVIAVSTRAPWYRSADRRDVAADGRRQSPAAPQRSGARRALRCQSA